MQRRGRLFPQANGLTTGLKQPSGKGQRLIVTHIGSEDGFVDGCLIDFKLSAANAILRDKIKQVTAKDWRKSIQHMMEVEAKFSLFDMYGSEHIQPIIIQLGKDHTDESDDCELSALSHLTKHSGFVDITEKSPDFEEFKTIEELFPVGKTCFMIGSPHYGCSGTVVDAKPENRAGRIMIKFKVPSEPSLDGIIRNERNLCQVHYMNAHQMSQQLGVNAQFVSRITGTVYIQMNSREAEAASLVNVGLHLKFNKTSEEIPGYSKRTNDAWLYSTKCLQVLKEYLAKYLGFVQRIIPFLGQDKIAVEDLYPKGVGKEEVKEVAKWIKEQDCTKVARVKSGAQLLDEGVVHAIEETVKRAKLLTIFSDHVSRPSASTEFLAVSCCAFRSADLPFTAMALTASSYSSAPLKHTNPPCRLTMEKKAAIIEEV
ncbi:hypothetical protein HPB51_003262 [Rhipicephalus microplus]|uniref:Exoribonuclease Xrn1 D2/D3 domain-containing protein n=1 Tax=Rhipicephalus microplus TaxID=6941 RepID=A0A9J6EWM3_RHIMP|nr:hypothetical protein HPB51_003262 [Rhipicephalus microplus]